MRRRAIAALRAGVRRLPWLRRHLLRWLAPVMPLLGRQIDKASARPYAEWFAQWQAPRPDLLAGAPPLPFLAVIAGGAPGEPTRAALAAQSGPAPQVLSADAPDLAAAIAACAANGYKVSALITDSAGDLEVLLSGDGAAVATQAIIKTKIATVMKYKTSSGAVLERSKTDPALAAELKANPAIGTVRQGAVPLMSGGEMIGVFGVGGAPGGDKDEACITAALAKFPIK